MMPPKKPIAIAATQAPARVKPSIYPEPYASQMAGRIKRPLGELFGLTNFGVNLTVLPARSVSALRHAHSRQDEFIYIVSGHPTLVTADGQTPMQPGMCAGFKAGTGDAHQLINETVAEVVYLEVGDRTAGDAVVYPDDDLAAQLTVEGWRFFHKDGSAY